MRYLGKLLASAIMVLSLAESAALPASVYAERSRLAEGHWVRIHPDTTGIYRISVDQLAEWGFRDASKVGVYGCGAIAPADHIFHAGQTDDLHEAPFIHDSDGSILFFAESALRARCTATDRCAITFNHYDSGSAYFLSDAYGSGDLKYAEPDTSMSPSADFHYSVNVIDLNLQNPCQGGVYFHGKCLAPGMAEHLSFHIRDMADAQEGVVRYVLAAGSETAFYPEVSIMPEGSGISAGRAGRTPDYRTYSTSSGIARFSSCGKNDFDVSFALRIPDDFNGDYAALDYLYACYPRKNDLARTSSLLMHFPEAPETVSLEGTSDKTELWDLSDSDTPLRLPVNSVDGTATVAVNGSQQSFLVAFDRSGIFPSPAFGGIVANQNLHGLGTPEMLIVTTDMLKDEAEELADIHRSSQGMDVAVVRQEEIFNEFSGGVRHPSALRRFTKMLADRKPGRLKHLLLYGPATWDNRFLVLSAKDILISLQAENSTHASGQSTNYCADQYFAMLDDSYNPSELAHTGMDINIGRIPTLSRCDAKAYNKKIAGIMENRMPSSAWSHILLFSDRGDDYAHLRQCSEISGSMTGTNPDLSISRADVCLRGDDSRHFISRELKSGTGFVGYCGHGSRDRLSARVWDIPAIRNTYYREYPFFMLATCNSFFTDRLCTDIGKELLFSPEGGATALIAAGRPVYLEYNKAISIACAQAYAELKPGDTYGDILRRGRSIMLATKPGDAEAVNALCYNFGGDPAVPVPIPEYRAIIESIDGQTVGDMSIRINAKQTYSFTARIIDKNGKTLSDFDGFADFRIHHLPATLSSDGSTDKTSDDSDILVAGSAKVEKGIIRGSFACGEAPICGTGSNRMTISASETSGGRMAFSSCRPFSILPAEPGSVPDSDSPDIIDAYINSPDMPSGTVYGPDIVFHAIISPSSAGLDFSEPMNEGLRLWLDGRRIAGLTGSIHASGCNTMLLRMPFCNLGEGHHSIRMAVRNSAGLETRKTIHFNVSAHSKHAHLVAERPEGEKGDVVFSLKSHAGFDVRLIVCSSDGVTVLSRENCQFPYRWDCKDRDCKEIPAGRYKAWAVFGDRLFHGSSDKVEIIVIR